MNRKIQKECESSCEYILPDYMGDIKKLLFYRAKAIPTGKFVGEGNLEISGAVEYELLYADTENKLTCVTASSDYSENFAINGDSYADSGEEAEVCSLKVRVTGPRKISMKAEVKSRLTLSEESAFDVAGDVFSDKNKAERCTRVINYAASAFKKSGEREYAEIAERLSEVSCDEVEVLLATGSVKISDVKASEGKVAVIGENIVTAILKAPDSPPFRIKKEIPFEEIVEAEGATAESVALADGFISSVSIGLSDDNGECVAVANVIAEYTVELIENRSAEVITDAYLTSCDTENKYCQEEYMSPVSSAVKEISLTVAADKNSLSISDAKEILAIFSEIRSPSATVKNNGCEISGEIVSCGVACEINVDGTVSYIPFKIHSDFKENVNLSCQLPENASVECTLLAVDCEPCMDSENITAKCSVTAKLSVFTKEKINRLSSCNTVLGETKAKKDSVITVYYPKNGEKLFDVAKRYKTTSQKIAIDNKLSETALSSLDTAESLLGVKKLIIR